MSLQTPFFAPIDDDAALGWVQGPTASRSWAHTILLTAAQAGLDAAALLRHAGLPPGLAEAERWPIDDITRLWRAAAALTGDRAFGLRVGAQVGPASFNVVGYLVQSAATLREALGLVQRFQRLISDGGRFQMLSVGEHVWLIYHPMQGDLAFSPHQIEAVLAAVVSFGRWVTGGRFEALQVQFAHGALAPMEAYQAALGCTPRFGEAFNGMLLPHRMLDAPLPQADAQLARVHTDHAQARLQALEAASAAGAGVSHPEQVLSALRRWLLSRLPLGLPGRAEAAAALGLSDRRLRRLLQRQGVHFSALLDEVRCQMCCDALRQGTALAAVAPRLGFGDAAALHRAFVRWTGQTPGRWRETQRQADARGSELQVVDEAGGPQA